MPVSKINWNSVRETMCQIQDPEMLVELRSRIRSGESVVEAMRFLIDLQLGPDSRLTVMNYFRTAFSLTIHESMTLGAWSFFNGSSWPDDAVNAGAGPLLVRYFEGKDE